MNMEQVVEWQLVMEADIFEANLPQCHFVCKQSHTIGPGPPRWGGVNGTAQQVNTNHTPDNNLRHVNVISHIRRQSFCFVIIPAALGPGVYSASNRNEYQKHKNNVSGE
jgi:hypothetical protein